MSPLRRRMLEDMATRGLRQDTQRGYVRFVRSFAISTARACWSGRARVLGRFPYAGPSLHGRPTTAGARKPSP